jgi:hypothetical protein
MKTSRSQRSETALRSPLAADISDFDLLNLTIRGQIFSGGNPRTSEIAA